MSSLVSRLKAAASASCSNGRWVGVVRNEDLALYDAKASKMFSSDCAQWLAHGRHSHLSLEALG
jgi:hypothetical protein